MSLNSDSKDLNDSFKDTIAFGTGGMREIMGPLPGQINKTTIALATHGLALHILKSPKQLWKKGVVICHDCRNHSREFAIIAARVFAGNHIPVHITKDLRPTPFCSFAIRHLGATGGVNITASHNPKEYNGYKVYWSDGGQVVAPHDVAIINEIHSIDNISSIPFADEHSPLITIIDESVEKAYFEALYDESLFKHDNELRGKNLKICYSPLHGAGITMIPDALKMWGFENIHLVKSQEKPDGNFPTTKTPNPETASARAEGIKTLEAEKGDLLLISDPDSDRLSVSERAHGSIHTFTGNELGAIFLHFLATNKELPDSWGAITTIVSTPLCKVITEALKGKCFQVLTGFKYISEKIQKWESGGPKFLFGFEESLGFLSSTSVRDKDAVLASCQIAEIALHLKGQGKTLLDYLYLIYKTYGLYREGELSIEFKDKSLLDAAIAPLMKNPPTTLLNKKVVQMDNYETKQSHNFLTDKTSILSLPTSKVLTLHLEDGSRYIFRPSGTEPKIKIYGSIHKSVDSNPIANQIESLDKALTSNLATLKAKFFK